MTKCIECGEPMTVRHENRKYDCGLDNVVLCNIEVRHCTRCGEEEVAIPRIEQLNRLIAHRLAQKTPRLMPKEIRFLRTYLGLASADLARRLGVTAATVSRWERADDPLGMKTAAERLLRLMVLFEEPVAHYPLTSLETMAVERPSALRLKVEAGRGGWREQHAAA